ncbi:MAG: hypothetical protein RLZZ436_1333 [Planctomycetota bacterium]
MGGMSMKLQQAAAVCVLLLTAAGAWAQQQPAVSAAAGTFTVTGDVDRPGNFSFNQPLTVRAAISAASPVSDAINVTVLRNGHDRTHSTRLLRLSAADSGEQAMSGDLYVVESVATPARPAPPNAVLRSPAGTTVISLEDAGVVIGDVLKGLGLPANSETRVSIPCRLHGQRSLDSAPLSASVQHGDVISVGSGSVATSDRQPGMRPMVSEWRGNSVRSAVQQPTIPRLPADARQQASIPVLPAPSQSPPGSANQNPPVLPPGNPAAVATLPGLQTSTASTPGIPAPNTAASGSASPKPAGLPDFSPRSAGMSDSRVVIVGDSTQTARRSTNGNDVIMLGDSLRTSPVAPAPAAQAPVPEIPRDRTSSAGATAGRNVSGNGSKVPVTAAVATRKSDSQPRPSATTTAATVPETTPAQVPPTLHWAVILGLFIAGTWILGRSLFIGSATAHSNSAVSVSLANPAVAVPTNVISGGAKQPETVAVAEEKAAAVTSGGEVPWRIYSVPTGLRKTDLDSTPAASEDELDLLIANRLPIERITPELPQSLELSGRSGLPPGRTIRRVDGPHSPLRGRHVVEREEAVSRRGRPLEERLSQLIRTVPASAPAQSSVPDRSAGSSGAVR